MKRFALGVRTVRFAKKRMIKGDNAMKLEFIYGLQYEPYWIGMAFKLDKTKSIYKHPKIFIYLERHISNDD